MPNSTTHGRTLDITEDLTEAQLAELSFGTEVVVYWPEHGDRHHGIIVGYEDPTSQGVGRFVIDVVEIRDSDSLVWRETGRTVKLKRGDFVVFGPANRESGDPDDPGLLQYLSRSHATPAIQETLINLASHQGIAPYLACAVEAMQLKTEIDQPVFHVRLDAKAHESGGYRYRVGLRPVHQPILHDEIHDVLAIASKHGLAASVANAAIDITAPEDI